MKKKKDIFAQNIDCGYTLKLPHRGIDAYVILMQAILRNTLTVATWAIQCKQVRKIMLKNPEAEDYVNVNSRELSRLFCYIV